MREETEALPDAPPPPLPADLPDGWRFDRDLNCPQCRYNLRMLRTPRCPECGLAFRWQAVLRIACPRCGESLARVDAGECPRCRLELDWRRLLGDADPELLKHFEYTNHPLRAAAGLLLSVWNAGRFWSQIGMESAPNIRRLRALRMECFAVCVLAFNVLVGLLAPAPGRLPFALGLTCAFFAVPAVTFVALPLFTPTLAQFRIQPGHVLRYSAYASVGLILFPIEAALLRAVDYLQRLRTPPDLLVGALLVVAAILLVLAIAWWLWFLYVALRRYLRLDARNAWALLLSTQAIALLTCCTALTLLLIAVLSR